MAVRQLQQAGMACQWRRVEREHEFRRALADWRPDVILSDFTLPQFDGLAALAVAVSVAPEIPFIFLSGTIGEERAIEALKRGATDYVIKDRPTRLVPAIRQALDRAEEARQHRQTEEALRQNRERFRKITENVADLIVMLDITGRCLYCNPAYRGAVGRPDARPEENIFNDVHEADRPTVQLLVRDTLRSGLSERAEYRLSRNDGSVRHVDAQATAVRDSHGNITQVLVVARDVTERRAAEQRIREQAALLDRAQDAIVVRDLHDRITYWNQGAGRLYGWNATAALGRPARELWTEDDSRLDIARRQTIFHGEWLGEMRQHTRHGTDITVQSRWTLLRDSEGTPTGFLVLSTDISEKRRLEAQLTRLQRLESIGLLASGVAHDINNVLAPIMLSAELLKPLVQSNEGRNLLASIEQGARHGSGLMQQLLAFSRGSAGVHSTLALQPMLDDFTGFLAQTFPRDIKVSLCLAADEPRRVRGDATQLKQVLMNLCLNARDAMPSGGRIRLTLSNVDLDDAQARSLGVARPGPHVLIAVADNGGGIPPELIEKVFDPFFTTKEVGKGSGMGLATVRGIVKGHDGALSLESQLGQGTTVRIYLPAQARDSTPPMELPVQKAGAGKIILLVDDDASVRDVLGALLIAHGYRVLRAGSGTEALQHFDRHDGEIALVLTDITMANMNGVELIERLRGRDSKLPILAMSGMAGAGFYEDQVGAHGVPLLAKPLMRANLFAAIDAALTPRGVASDEGQGPHRSEG